MSEKDKQNLEEKLEENQIKTKKRNRTSSNNNSSIDLKKNKKLKIDEKEPSEIINFDSIPSTIKENVRKINFYSFYYICFLCK